MLNVSFDQLFWLNILFLRSMLWLLCYSSFIFIMPYEWNIYHNLFTHLCILSIIGEHLHHYYCFDISYMTPGGQSCWDVYLGIKRPSVLRCIFSFTSWCQTLSNVTVTVDTPTTKCGSFIDLSFLIITTFSFRLLQCNMCHCDFILNFLDFK